MTAHADLLPRYKQLRQAGRALNNLLVDCLSKSIMNEGGRKLGLLEEDILVLDTDDEMAVLMDHCIHDIRRHGINTVERYLSTSPPAEGSDDWVLLNALRNSRFSMFLVEEVERDVGVQVRDLLRDTTTFLVDVGFGSSAKVGMVFALRMMTADGISMTTGSALPLGKLSKAERTEIIRSLRATFAGVDFNNMAPEEATDFTATVLRTCLAEGAATGIAYLDVRDEPPPARQPRRKKRKE